MKLLKIIPVFLLIGFTSFAQEKQDLRDLEDLNDFKSYFSIKAGVNAVDSAGDWSPFDSFTSEEELAFNKPYAVGVDYRFSRLLSVGLFGSINQWKVDDNDIIDNVVVTEDTDYFAIDLNAKLFIDELLFGNKNYDKDDDGVLDSKFDENGDGYLDHIQRDWLDIYVSAGAGMFSERDTGLSGNLGLGGNLWLTNKLGVNLEGVAKFSEKQYTTSNHFQYFAGVTYRFVDNDYDNDGIVDSKDVCPTVAGSKDNSGCPIPDSDNDGVVDSKDDCPNTFGLGEFNGCPDSDGDGVMDKEDTCPNVAGTMALNGCPDTDGDGITDADDNCPNVAGTVANNGCEEPKQEVVNQPVVPQLTQSEYDSIWNLSKTISFDTDEFVIKEASNPTIDKIIAIIKKYPTAYVKVIGHTDAKASTEYNQRLSISRAQYVKDYLLNNGLQGYNISIEGKGETEPIASNLTNEGRSKNRRVEISAGPVRY